MIFDLRGCSVPYTSTFVVMHRDDYTVSRKLKSIYIDIVFLRLEQPSRIMCLACKAATNSRR